MVLANLLQGGGGGGGGEEREEPSGHPGGLAVVLVV